MSISERSDSGPAQDALGLGGRRPNIELLQSFEVSCPPQDVWEFFGDIERVVRCLPGASLTRPPDGDRVDGKFSARLGPITATFTGAARIVRDDEKLRGVVLGAGNDRLSGSRAAGEIEYVLLPAGTGTRVELVIRALLAGPLAQFGRSGIVEDLVSRVAQAFARNLEARLMGSVSDIETPTSAPLAAGSLLRQVLATRLKAVLARLFHLSGPQDAHARFVRVRFVVSPRPPGELERRAWGRSHDADASRLALSGIITEPAANEGNSG